MLPDFFIFRFILTLLIYSIIYNLQSVSIIFIVLLLIIVDDFDSGYLRMKYKNIFHKFDSNYKKYDKINDSLSYIFILPIIYKLVSPDIFKLLIFATIFRLYGVINYYNNNNSLIFVMIPDLFKEILLVEYLSQNYKTILNNKNIVLIITTILKIGFEYWHHKLNKFNN
jgi:hypothetical protein